MENLDRSCEPMDIDLSANSTQLMDISFTEIPMNTGIFLKQENGALVEMVTSGNNLESNDNKLAASQIKKYHLNIQSRKTNTAKKYSISILFVVCLSTICYHMFDIKCSELNLDYLRVSLPEKVYGQVKAINDLIRMLESEGMSALIFFSGGTGVGKTLTASIMLESMGSSSNIYHYTMPSFVNIIASELMIGMTFCKSSVIIVDDLSLDDTKAVEHIKEVILKSEKLNKNITIVLIYNCDLTIGGYSTKCEESFYTKLLEMYRDVPLLKKIIKFEPLKEEHLIKCIENELGRKVAQGDVGRMLKNFNVSIDGCKGVHTKMKIMNNI